MHIKSIFNLFNNFQVLLINLKHFNTILSAGIKYLYVNNNVSCINQFKILESFNLYSEKIIK